MNEYQTFYFWLIFAKTMSKEILIIYGTIEGRNGYFSLGNL